jgi:hypothetical protein
MNKVAIDTGAIVGGLVFGGGDSFPQNTVESTFECNRFDLEWIWKKVVD